VSIETGDIIEGRLPGNARRLVEEWAARNRVALMRNWERARMNEQPERIAGLDVD
jgi:hypothetical protein